MLSFVLERAEPQCFAGRSGLCSLRTEGIDGIKLPCLDCRDYER